MNHPFFTHGLIAMAHRGFHGPTVTENSMEAFEAAVGLGYRHLESDLHVTSDGVAVLAHDPDLIRVARSPERIADLTWGQLSTKRLINGERLPRLDELLTTWPEIHVNLDAKVPQVVEVAARVIRTHGAEERVCVGSFSHRAVLSLRGHLPRAAHSASPREVAAWRVGRRVAGPHAFMVPPRSGPIRVVSRTTVARAHRWGTGVHVWTVNDVDQMRDLIRLGVDGLMTDRADLLKEVLIEEGKWI